MAIRGEGQNNYYDQRRRSGPASLLIGAVMSLMKGRQSHAYDQRQNEPYDQQQMIAHRPGDVDLKDREIGRVVPDVPAKHSSMEPDSKTRADSFGNRGHSDDESDDADRTERGYERPIQSIVAQQSQGQQFTPPPGPPPSYRTAIRGN